MKRKIGLARVLVGFLLLSGNFLFAQQPEFYRDLTHPSKVFGHNKNYRIYLPEGYETSRSRYPVIYFFHGWGGRHFKDDNAKLEYELLKKLVDKYKAIMVMWDGTMDGIEPRPYNIGDHEDIKFRVQMKDYFPELVQYIDATYRTRTDRDSRGIIGFSMGGFMSFYLAGKYPDRISAAVDFAGTPEFFVGYIDNHTLYPLRYTFKNLRDVKTRQHNGDSDILVYLNEEVQKGAQWEGVPYEYYPFHGGHMVDLPGETRVFEMAMKFVANAFKQKTTKPALWSHYDLYPDFSVWDYQVKSDKKEPGFIFLKDVSGKGFGVYTNKWLPYGPALDTTRISITTSAAYEPNKNYQVVRYLAATQQESVTENKADAAGKLTFETDASGVEIGIFNKNDAPQFSALDYSVNGQKNGYIQTGKPNSLALRLFNRGGESGIPGKIRVIIQTSDNDVKLADTVVETAAVAGQRVLALPSVPVVCSKTPPAHAEPSAIKFRLTVYFNNRQYKDEIEVPVIFEAAEFSHPLTDDGRLVKDAIFGKGNADGKVNPGERIMIYEGEHRLRLYTADPWVIRSAEKLKDEILPAIWPDGFTFSSIIQVSPDCPAGHVIECIGSYETKTHNPIDRRLTWGKVRLTVQDN